MPDETVKDKVAREDHDTLVRVETVLNNMATDVKNLADGTTQRLTTLESRATALERINDEVKPLNLEKAVTDHDRQLRELKTTTKTIIWIVGGSMAVIGSLITFLSRFFGLLK